MKRTDCVAESRDKANLLPEHSSTRQRRCPPRTVRNLLDSPALVGLCKVNPVQPQDPQVPIAIDQVSLSDQACSMPLISGECFGICSDTVKGG
jgi:hypothetical protein